MHVQLFLPFDQVVELQKATLKNNLESRVGIGCLFWTWGLSRYLLPPSPTAGLLQLAGEEQVGLVVLHDLTLGAVVAVVSDIFGHAHPIGHLR